MVMALFAQVGFAGISDGLVLYLNADGNANDASGNGNHGGMRGGAQFVPGKVGQAFSFDGVDDYVLVPSSPWLPAGPAPRTIALWVYTRASSWSRDANTIFHSGLPEPKQSFSLDMDYYPNMDFYTWSLTPDHENDIYFDADVPAEGWVHVAIVYDGDWVTVYTQGQQRADKNYGTLETASTDIEIGGFEYISSYFDGLIDEFLFYDRALSESEIQELASGVLPPPTDPPPPPPTDPPPPTVHEVTPSSGSTSGGTSITITGSNFGSSQGTTGRVIFSSTTSSGGGAWDTLIDYTSWSDTKIVCLTPVHPTAGDVDVWVVADNGSSGVKINGFKYIAPLPPTVREFAPSSGSTLGGTEVTIKGSNFGSSRGVGRVRFGGRGAAAHTSWTDNQIVCVAPTHFGGPPYAVDYWVDVEITTNDLLSVTLTNKFKYMAPLISLSTSSGSTGGGTKVTITCVDGRSWFGSSQETGRVTFGGTKAIVNFWSDNQIVCFAPANPAAGTVDVRVVADSGLFGLGNQKFSYWAPKISRIDASSGTKIGTVGPTAGGTDVVIKGWGFGSLQGGGHVTFGGSVAEVSYWHDSQVVCKTPSHVKGIVDVVVTMNSGVIATKTNGFAYADVVYVDGSVSTSGDGISWRTAKKTIQEGIDAVLSNNMTVMTVLVKYGPYNITKPIDFGYQNIKLASDNGTNTTYETAATDASQCIIDAEGRDIEVFYFDGGQISDAVVRGFTIKGAGLRSLFERKSGIYCDDSSPTITKCIITGNTGSGISCVDSSPTITKCTITGNRGKSSGGIYSSRSNPTIEDCKITDNAAVWYSGGMHFERDSHATITNCTFTGNSPAGISFKKLSAPRITPRGVKIWVMCPVDIEVIDPDGLITSGQSDDNSDAIYVEGDIDADGDLDDSIIFRTRKNGDYSVRVLPEPDAPPGATYTLKFTTEEQELVLAENVLVVDAPNQPVGIEVAETEISVAPMAYFALEAVIDEGNTFTIPGYFEDADSSTWTATVNYGDGSETQALEFNPAGKSFTLSHVYADNGTYTVTVTVTDDEGNAGSNTMKVTVNNVAPTVAAGADQTADEGATVSLAPEKFNDLGTLDTHTATINWGDGTPTEAGAVTETPSGPPGATAGADGEVSSSHVYADNGTYTVTVTVKDDDGAPTSDSFTVTVGNVAPTVVAGEDQTVEEGATVGLLAPSTFNDLGTLDTHTVAIDWGDGTPVENGTVTQSPFGPPGSTDGSNGTASFGTHVYADDGNYDVKVTVTDDDGASTSDTLEVTVNNVAPTVDAGADQTAEEGAVVSLAPATFNDKGTADIHTATIDWGDGIVEDGTVTESPSGPPGSTTGTDGTASFGTHVYADDGNYAVKVTVTDDDGASISDTLEVTVNNVAPTVDAGADQTAEEGAVVSLAPATFNDLGTLDTHKATIDWGDGTSVDAGTVDESLSGPPGSTEGADGTVSGSHI